MIIVKTWVHNITKEEYSADRYSNHGGLGQDSTKYKDLPYDGYPYSLKEHVIEGTMMPKTFSHYSEHWEKNNEDMQRKIDDVLKNVHT